MSKSKSSKPLVFLLFVLSVFLFLGNEANAQNAGQIQDEKKCDFSQDKPLNLSHNKLLFESAVKRVEPIYPAAAKLIKAEGRVEVSLLVNRQGEVVKGLRFVGASVVAGICAKGSFAMEVWREFWFHGKTETQVYSSGFDL